MVKHCLQLSCWVSLQDHEWLYRHVKKTDTNNKIKRSAQQKSRSKKISLDTKREHCKSGSYQALEEGHREERRKGDSTEERYS